MSKLIKKLINKNLISPPSFLKDTIQYLCITGSAAYGVANIDSDLDIYGYCISPKSILFPHTMGYIQGLDKDIPKFDQWQQHKIIDSEEGKEYDFSIYSNLKYFRLVMDGNPNMIDTLFVPRNLIIHTTKLHELVRENRKLFLSKKIWHTFKGYSYNQLRKMLIKKSNLRSNRYNLYLKYGYDIKNAYHVVRLLNECQMMLEENDLDLQRNREQLKSIRRGEWSKDQVINYFAEKELLLEKAHQKSSLPNEPNMKKIKKLYLDCLEIYYGSLDNIVERKKDVDDLVNDIQFLLDRYKK